VGNSWNIESNGTIGRIGSTMVNSGLALSVDGEKFVSYQPLMTPDGKEFVLTGASDGEHSRIASSAAHPFVGGEWYASLRRVFLQRFDRPR
jgi:hypothetical protein